jgi:hypothetical protein
MEPLIRFFELFIRLHWCLVDVFLYFFTFEDVNTFDSLTRACFEIHPLFTVLPVILPWLFWVAISQTCGPPPR